MADTEAPWLDLLFGEIYDEVNGKLTPLPGGIEFMGGLRARLNSATRRVEAYSAATIEESLTISTRTALATDARRVMYAAEVGSDVVYTVPGDVFEKDDVVLFLWGGTDGAFKIERGAGMDDIHSADGGPAWLRTQWQVGMLRFRSPTSAVWTASDPGVVIVDDGATSFTPAEIDRGSHREFSSASPITVTLPAGLPKGFSGTLTAAGTGAITMAAGAGATLAANGGKVTSDGQGATIAYVNLGSDEWRIFGGLV